jgi:transcriptional regulator with XRE-family HTH domain
MIYDNIAIGSRAYEARKAKNIKQSEISTALGITQPSYSKFEYGQYDMPISQIIKLCEILDVSVSWLIGENIVSDQADKERLLVDEFIRNIKIIRNKS